MALFTTSCASVADQWQFFEENDVFGGGSDRHYTQGARVSVTTRHETMSAADAWTLHGLQHWFYETLILLTPVLGEADDRHSDCSFFFGQNIYTPEDISRETPDPLDRPYAGHLYLGFSARNTWFVDDELDRSSQLAFRVGTTGPLSFAEETQDFVHRLIGSQRPKGWRHQVSGEPTVQFDWSVKRRLFRVRFGDSSFGADSEVFAGMSLGSILMSGEVGLGIRIGRGLQRDFLPPTLEPSPAGRLGLSARRTPPQHSAYVFVSTVGRGVAHSTVLEGSLFRNEDFVDPKPWVDELRAGLGYRYGAYFLTYMFVSRSKEFDGQRFRRGEFASLTTGLSWSF